VFVKCYFSANGDKIVDDVNIDDILVVINWKVCGIIIIIIIIIINMVYKNNNNIYKNNNKYDLQ
jgi:hypothetical protein